MGFLAAACEIPFSRMQMELLLSAAVYMRRGREDYLSDSRVDTIVPVAFLIFEPIQIVNSIYVKRSPLWREPNRQTQVIL